MGENRSLELEDEVKVKKGKKSKKDKTKVIKEEIIEDDSLSAKVKSALSYALFFAVIIGIFLSSGDGPRVIGGYGVFNVLTRSMQSTIPQDSLVITKNVEARELQIGDDITFMAGPTSTITHRIIGIQEDYNRTGMRGFTTQGTDNSTKDKDVVVESNIVGKVIFHNYHLGLVTVFLQKNCYYIIGYLVMFLLIKNILLKFMGEEDDEEDDPEDDEDNSELPLYGDGVDAQYNYMDPYGTGYLPDMNNYQYDEYGNPITYNYGYDYNSQLQPYAYDEYGQPIVYDYDTGESYILNSQTLDIPQQW